MKTLLEFCREARSLCRRHPATFAAAVILMLSGSVNTARAADPPSFSAPDIKAAITYLASPGLKGRRSGEPGNAEAARYIAKQFAADGLVPIGFARQDELTGKPGSGYFQAFRFPAGRRLGMKSELAVRAAQGEPLVAKHSDFVPAGMSAGGTVDGPLAFAGFGIRAPEAKWDDYASLDVHGKVVLVLAGVPLDQSGTHRLADFTSLRRKVLTARDLGAKAVLVVTADDPNLPAPPNFAYADTSDAGLPVVQVGLDFCGAIFSAAGLDPNSLLTAATNTAGGSAARDIPVRVHLKADIEKLQLITANIVGVAPGTDPRLKSEYVVVGAHMDHLGMGGPGSLAQSQEPAVHPGADDNASGTAGVLQLAHYYGPANPKHPPHKRSIVFICFSGEELGLLGSDYYVHNPLETIASTVAMVNMDMIGRLKENKLVVSGTGTATEWNDLLDTANKKAGFTLSRSDSGFGASDQQSFYTGGLPVLFFFTGLHEDYHTPTDTADKINAPGEAKVLLLVNDVVASIADAPGHPHFQKMAASSGGASRGFKVYFGSVPDYAAQADGVLLSGVRPGSPAEQAGLKAGDVIVKFGDTTVHNIQDYATALSGYHPGDRVEVVVMRGGVQTPIPVVLGAPRE